MRHFLMLLSVILIGNVAMPQHKKLDISQRVSIGEEVPQIPSLRALFHHKELLDLSDYEDKVIVLDFFDTYCSSCIASLPKLQKLQDDMKEKVKIILISWQDSSVINKFWRNNKMIRENRVSLPVVYADSLLRKYFPYAAVPHVVWIKDSRVGAITHSDFVTGENIDQLFNHGQIQLPLKQDFVVTDGASSASSENVIGMIRLTGFQNGRPTEGFRLEHDSITGASKVSFYNMSVLGAYTSTWSKIRKPRFLLRPNRIVWNVADSAMYEFFGQDGEMQIWLSKHGICYERYEKNQRPIGEQAEIVLDDLNKMLGIKVYWSHRKMDALVIKGQYKAPNDSAVSDDGGNNIEGTSVLAFMLDMAGSYPPVVDRVNTKEWLFLKDYNNLEELNNYLKNYGLFIEKEETDVEVLVIEPLGESLR